MKLTKPVFIFVLIMNFCPIFQEAYALTTLQQASTVRFLYWLVNGPPSTGYPSGFDGPSEGFLGMIREINGPQALGGGLNSCGYTTCSSIPTSGACTKDEEGGVSFTMIFESPSVSVPSGYSSGSGSGYDRRVSVRFYDGINTVDFMVAEFNCNNSSGYLRFHEPHNDNDVAYTAATRNTARNLEVYYDTTTATSSKLELAMFVIPTVKSSSTPEEKFLAKFSTGASNTFQLWVTRYFNDGTNEDGFRTAIHGNTSTGIANVFMQHDTTPDGNNDTTVTGNTGNVSNTAGDIDCIDFNDGASPSDASGSCGSLSLSAAGSPVVAPTGDFSIDYIKDSLMGQMSSF